MDRLLVSCQLCKEISVGSSRQQVAVTYLLWASVGCAALLTVLVPLGVIPSVRHCMLLQL